MTSPHKFITQNRKATHEYFIDERLEAGIVLTGTEVKSLRAGKASLNEAHAGEMDGRIWLFNATIEPYAGGNRFNHEPRRPRLLLMSRREIGKLLGMVRIKGMTLIPLSLYFGDRGFVKVDLGVARGKKKYEKRQSEKEKDWNKEKGSLLKKTF